MSIDAINQVVAQMRLRAAQITSLPSKRPGIGAANSSVNTTNATPNFKANLNQALEKVNEWQTQAQQLQHQFQIGEDEVDLTQVVVANKKAEIGFQATLQVRNKLIKAYEDIMNMPL